MKVERRLVDVEEVAYMLGMSKNTIYCWVSQGRIPFVKCGRSTRFDLQEIDKWIKENSVKERRFDQF